MTTLADVAARNALAAYLQGKLGLSADACQPDWFPSSMALPRPVAVSVHAAGEVTQLDELDAPVVDAVTVGAGVAATVLYRLGRYDVPLAIDLWCATQAARDAQAQALEDALNAPVQVGGSPIAGAQDGLALACDAAEYFGARADFLFDRRALPATPEGADRDAWRAVFTGRARLDRLVQRAVTRQTALQLLTALGPAVVTSTSPAGTTTRTIFTGF